MGGELQVNEKYQAVMGKSLEYQGEGIMITPLCIGQDDYWIFRVLVSNKQAIVGFPKLGTIGIGFQHEEDWNTNLPYTSDAVEIYEHIRHNRLNARRPKCIEAIRMIQAAAKTFKEQDGTRRD